MKKVRRKGERAARGTQTEKLHSPKRMMQVWDSGLLSALSPPNSVTSTSLSERGKAIKTWPLRGGCGRSGSCRDHMTVT